MKILVVDDEKSIVDILEYNLSKDGYEVVTAYDGEEGFEKFKEEDPDLILLDVMMPKMDGIAVCKEIRKTSNVPIIMITAKSEEVDKVLGLELGADDYVTKPFSVRELMARVKANVRRAVAPVKSSETENKILESGDIKIDLNKFEVYKRGEVVELTVREFELLKYLLDNKGKVCERESLLEKVWGYEYYGDVRTVDVTVRRLRGKLEDTSSKPNYILTKRGVGYYFNDEK